MAHFSMFGFDQEIVIPHAEINHENISNAQRRIRSAGSGKVLGIIIPFEKNALATTFLGRPSASPKYDVVKTLDGSDVTTLAADVYFNEHETARYMLAVNYALQELAADPKFSKIVLSRSERYSWQGAHPARMLICCMSDLYPKAYRYHAVISEEDNDVIAGATPELFLSKRGNRVYLRPLAGTVPGFLHKDEAERQLLTPKYLEEHALLVDFLVDKLRWVSDHITYDEMPAVIAADSVWHLCTEVVAYLPNTVSIDMLVNLLHPSPAVCGVSQENANRLIGKLEPPRGYYGGLIGWLTPEGDGELYVALRGLKVDGGNNHVTLRSGGGITSASDPYIEFEETSHKLRPMRRTLSALNMDILDAGG